MALCGKLPVRQKLIAVNEPTERVTRINCLGCQLLFQDEVDVNHKLQELNYM
jgi:hypothetical protein